MADWLLAEGVEQDTFDIVWIGNLRFTTIQQQGRRLLMELMQQAIKMRMWAKRPFNTMDVARLTNGMYLGRIATIQQMGGIMLQTLKELGGFIGYRFKLEGYTRYVPEDEDDQRPVGWPRALAPLSPCFAQQQFMDALTSALYELGRLSGEPRDSHRFIREMEQVTKTFPPWVTSHMRLAKTGYIEWNEQQMLTLVHNLVHSMPPPGPDTVRTPTPSWLTVPSSTVNVDNVDVGNES
jgi:hypothetical protein